MPKVKAEGDLFKDPQQPTVGQMLASPAWSSLGVRLNTGPATETMKSAIALVTQLSCEWEADTENFMKLVDGWMATGWEQNMNDLLQPRHYNILLVLLNGSYTKVGKSVLLLNQCRARLKSINMEPRVYTIDFLKTIWNKVTEFQQYCDIAYAAETIVKTIPALKAKKQISDTAAKFKEEMKQKKINLGADLSQRLEMLFEGASLPALGDFEKPEEKPAEAEVPVLVDGDATQPESKKQRTS